MSVGSIIGGVFGGIVGFFVGGPMGAFYGASIGFGIGMAIDPITPDMPAIGSPNPDENVMKSTIGNPVLDLTGTAKITGHLLCFGKERNEPVYSESSGSGGKGGPPEPPPQITGRKYYMSWAVGLIACSGDSEINTLYTVYKNDDVVWEGELDCPASGGQETITLDGVGSLTFYFGTNDQVANSKVGEIISDSTLNTPYRNLCWAFFDDCYIGEYNRTPTFKFVIKKIPSNAFNENDTIQIYDVNPAHSMWYIFSKLAGLPESWLSSSGFSTLANTLFTEFRGISVLFDRQQSVLSYIESINSHIDNIIRYGADSKFHPKLIRDDYTIGDLPTIDETVMLGEPSFNRKSWIDTINETKVQYTQILDPNRLDFNLGDCETVDIGIQLKSIAWGNISAAGEYGRFVGGGANGSIYYSDDGGDTWTQCQGEIDSEDTLVSFENDKFVAACSYYTYISDDGKSWTQGTQIETSGGCSGTPAWNATNSVYVLNYYLAPRPRIYTSTDGLLWTYQMYLGIYGSLRSSQEYKGKQYTAAYNYTFAYTSVDCANWIDMDPKPPFSEIGGTPSMRGQFATDGSVLAYSGCYTESSGGVWVLNGGGYFTFADYNPVIDYWVAVQTLSYTDFKILKSENGKEWEDICPGIGLVIYDIALGNDRSVTTREQNSLWINKRI